ncbi:MAG: helix-turn-helix domain-containing protein [Gemmatimonadales bacterium]|jgi:DNA-binding NtrC family response regulator|nr:helix-turn-helix domain-containing protein [Gemmatimonadales bacterium]MDZ4257519.1 helix-turn-helix domain-containing protein [Gemmatimonadales bacterium]MDZ4389487.1 helix-turn-helix domain-containing protein [Gemmatimonadales bacterium]
MSSLHIRLLTSNPARDDVQELVSTLRAAGHLVISSAAPSVPGDVAPAPDFVVTEAAAQPVPETLDAAEARHIAAVLEFTHGNRRQAALLLGIARSTLLAKIRRHGL